MPPGLGTEETVSNANTSNAALQAAKSSEFVVENASSMSKEATSTVAPDLSLVLQQQTRRLLEVETQLTELRALNASLILQLSQKREEDELQETKKSLLISYETIDKLNNSNTEKTKQVKQLEAEKQQLKATNMELRDLQQRTLASITELNESQQKLGATLLKNELQASQLNDTIKKLTSTEEKQQQKLIDEKLLPLTEGYLTHLFNSAMQFNPELNSETEQRLTLPSITLPDRKDQQSYNTIVKKFSNVSKLKAILTNTDLTNTELTPLPSKRVEKFKQALTSESDQSLKDHRDKAGVRYFKTCAAILGIIITGVIPGLLAMGLYQAVFKPKKPLFFDDRSHGAEYMDDCQSMLGVK